MRLAFAEALHKEMESNPNIHLIVGDLGYFIFDKIRESFPERFTNTGAAEQVMMNIGIGMALSGKIPVVYSITPFLLHRPYEAIKLYLEGEGIHVKLVGSGRCKDYDHDGPSHWESEFPFSFKHYRPEIISESLMKDFLYNNEPSFLSLSR